jgi:hypothetical protein
MALAAFIFLRTRQPFFEAWMLALTVLRGIAFSPCFL